MVNPTNYKLRCNESNDEHTRFTLFDRGAPQDEFRHAANCGEIVIRTCDLYHFLRYCWNGNIDWNNNIPESLLEKE